MKFRNRKSIIIISGYFLLNIFILLVSFRHDEVNIGVVDQERSMAPEYTIVEELEYFHLKDGLPQMSLSADKMVSQGEEIAEFDFPKGVYNYREKDQTLKYRAENGIYQKLKELLTLTGKVEVKTIEAEYFADSLKYFFGKDLFLGSGNVKFTGDDLKTKDHLIITSENMQAHPKAQVTKFKGNVKGTLQRQKKYEGQLNFASRELVFKGAESLAHLQGDVVMKRQGYVITSGKADMHLENFNKSLKYFVLNDDVKVKETLQTPEGTAVRKAYAERLEGYGREEKMILSGAPRIEMGKDVIKGYRITIREGADLVEVDDAMTDVQVKRAAKLKE